MISHRTVCLLVAIFSICLFISTPGHAYVIDFEDISESTSVADYYENTFGLTFSNATVLTAGSYLNEFDFPPTSGINVVFDDGGPIIIDFSTPVMDAGGFFTYMSAISLEAFDVNNAKVGSLSMIGSNLGYSNFMQIAFAAGISHLVITGDLTVAGGSFTLDDFTATPMTNVPEPSSLLLLVSGLIGMIGLRRFY